MLLINQYNNYSTLKLCAKNNASFIQPKTLALRPVLSWRNRPVPGRRLALLIRINKANKLFQNKSLRDFSFQRIATHREKWWKPPSVPWTQCHIHINAFKHWLTLAQNANYLVYLKSVSTVIRLSVLAHTSEFINFPPHCQMTNCMLASCSRTRCKLRATTEAGARLNHPAYPSLPPTTPYPPIPRKK